MSSTQTTKHTHQVVFGRKVDSCPRCQELAAGAPPVRWSNSQRDDERQLAEVRRHNCQASHCGVVCTFGDW